MSPAPDWGVERHDQPGFYPGRCLRLTILGKPPHDACLYYPSQLFWRVEGQDFVLGEGGLSLGHDRSLRTDASGFAVMPLGDYQAQVDPDIGWAFCQPAQVLDAVAAARGPYPPPVMPLSCSPSWAFVLFTYTDLTTQMARDGEVVALTRSGPTGTWAWWGPIPPRGPGRCEALPASAHESCSLLGFGALPSG